MPKTYSRRQIEQGLRRKGFVSDMNDHRYLRFILKGKRTPLRPFLQHGGGGRDVDIGLIKLMAAECLLSISDFRALVECPLGREELSARFEVTSNERHGAFVRGRGERLVGANHPKVRALLRPAE